MNLCTRESKIKKRDKPLLCRDLGPLARLLRVVAVELDLDLDRGSRVSFSVNSSSRVGGKPLLDVKPERGREEKGEARQLRFRSSPSALAQADDSHGEDHLASLPQTLLNPRCLTVEHGHLIL